jgi:hypothetical protein
MNMICLVMNNLMTKMNIIKLQNFKKKKLNLVMMKMILHHLKMMSYKSK